MSKDYYAALGLSSDASSEDVRRAYRGLAHVYHPDKDGGDERIFKSITEAYSILINAEKRKEYDSGQKQVPPQKPAVQSAKFPAGFFPVAIGGLAILFAVVAFSHEGGTSNEMPVPIPSVPEIIASQSVQFAGQMTEPEPSTFTLGAKGQSIRQGSVTLSPLTTNALGSRLGREFGQFNPSFPASMGQYYQIKFTATNEANRSTIVRLKAFILEDEDGKEFGPDQIYHCEKPNQHFGTRGSVLASQGYVTLKPGIPCEWELLFEVASTSERFILRGGFE